VERRTQAWPSWAITTEIDTGEHWRTVLRAAQQHRTQIPAYDRLLAMSDDGLRKFWGKDTYYRAFSTVNGGREKEHDLFAGLRDATESERVAGALAAYATLWLA
jgi:hypothetical protein